MRLRSINWGGDELPNCFLERSRLGRSLPCAIRLRPQRSDHMAVVCVARLTPRAWDIESIFPIKDAASAALMVIKADCLHNAGVISDGEKQWVHTRARPFLADGTFKDAA